ncbi:MAG: DUF4149 domain-containing protein [Gammaproteobacteria bacterium]
MDPVLAVLGRGVLVFWVGSLWTIGIIVAPTLFTALPDTALAGSVAGRLFTAEAWISVVSAPVLLLLWRRCYPDIGTWPGIVVASMGLLAAAGEWWLRPLMQAAREGVVDGSADFAFLHGLASIMYFMVAGAGLALLCAPVWGRPRN